MLEPCGGLNHMGCIYAGCCMRDRNGSPQAEGLVEAVAANATKERFAGA